MPVYTGDGADTASVSPLVTQWLDRQDPAFRIEGIHFQSVDALPNGRVLFAKLKGEVYGPDGAAILGNIVFLRGGSVSILLLLRCKGELYVVLVVQPRFAICESAFPETIAGMLDGDGNFAGVAAKELKEEAGIVLDPSALINLTELIYGKKFPGMYPSSGACDEFEVLYFKVIDVEPEALAELQGRCHGCLEEGEKIVLQIVPFRDAIRTSSDAKLLCSIALLREAQERGLINEHFELERSTAVTT